MSNPQRVLVTGASTGFGYAASVALAARGHAVYAAMRDPSGRNAGPAAALSALGVRVLAMDLRDAGSVGAAVATAEADGGLDAVVNNAGVMPVGVTEAFSEAQFKDVLETNLVGAFRLMQAVLPGMRARGRGLLVHTSSVLGRLVFPFHGVYAASKFGLEGLAEAVRYEVSGLGIDSVIVEPGPFATQLLANAPAPERADVVAAYGPLGGIGAQMKAATEGLVANPEMPVNPELVAQAFVQLVEAAPGSRPARLTVGIDMGVGAMNETVAGFQRAAIELMGLGALDKTPVEA